jgi:hypothetical protein
LLRNDKYDIDLNEDEQEGKWTYDNVILSKYFKVLFISMTQNVHLT